MAWASRWDTYLRMNDVEVRACTQPDRRHLGGKGRGKGALCMYMDPPWSKPLDLLWFWSTILPKTYSTTSPADLSERWAALIECSSYCTCLNALVNSHNFTSCPTSPYPYPSLPCPQVHWFAICNSVAIVLFLSGILALILVRTLRRDIARYNRLSDDTEFVSWAAVLSVLVSTHTCVCTWSWSG